MPSSDDSPVETEQGAAKSVSTERTFDEDVADLAQLETYLREMARELCEGLERRGRRGRTIAIKVRLDDWTTVTRARTVDARTNEPVTVIEVAVELRRAYAPTRPVRLLGVRQAGFEDVEPEPRRAPAAASGRLALEIRARARSQSSDRGRPQTSRQPANTRSTSDAL